MFYEFLCFCVSHFYVSVLKYVRLHVCSISFLLLFDTDLFDLK